MAQPAGRPLTRRHRRAYGGCTCRVAEVVPPPTTRSGEMSGLVGIHGISLRRLPVRRYAGTPVRPCPCAPVPLCPLSSPPPCPRQDAVGRGAQHLDPRVVGQMSRGRVPEDPTGPERRLTWQDPLHRVSVRPPSARPLTSLRREAMSDPHRLRGKRRGADRKWGRRVCSLQR